MNKLRGHKQSTHTEKCFIVLSSEIASFFIFIFICLLTHCGRVSNLMISQRKPVWRTSSVSACPEAEVEEKNNYSESAHMIIKTPLLDDWL